MKKISIVFEQTGPREDGQGFNAYLEGMTAERRREIDAMTPEEQLQKLSAAEFWALRCFQITVAAIVDAGAARETKRR
jgi:hypothetical protein